MGKKDGFREFKRKGHSYEPVEKRIKDYKEFIVPLSKEELGEQGARCMDCGTPFCHPNCPLHNIMPEFNDQVYRGKWKEALQTLLSTNNFPEFTGRVCPALCESGCVLGIIDKPVTIKNLELAIIENAYKEGTMTANRQIKRTGKKVAVVGSGPSGLALADQLNKAGHLVTVYERADRIGGLLRYGIPDFKLGKDILDRRIKLMEAEGITFVTKANIGVDVPAAKLKMEFDVVAMACGATVPRDLPIPGRDAKGVYLAMQFLAQNNKRVAGDAIPKDQEIHAKGKHVLVIGGGDTGSDCVGTSIRHGAASVTQIELLPKPPANRTEDTAWPVFPGPRMLSTSTSQEEGCVREWSVLSKEFLKDAAGNVTGVKHVKINWLSPTKFEELPGTEGVYKADLVFLAMGFLYTEPKGLLEELGVQKDERGNVKTDGKFQTNVPGVFSAGDMRRGQSLVVWAISEGRECAYEIDKFLMGGVSRLESKAHLFSDTLLR
ncbi:MAG: glutamate synthase subunit beta [Nitrospinae bacterium]|nr:glutamate synthase subunit beta [Nitrospinota bacterium]